MARKKKLIESDEEFEAQFGDKMPGIDGKKEGKPSQLPLSSEVAPPVVLFPGATMQGGNIHIPEMTPEVEELVASLDENQMKGMLGYFIRANDNPDSFAHFYQVIHGAPLLPHARKWVVEAYKARADGKGVVVEAFRGSTKTTTMTITFTAYRIGKDPARANLLIQVGDDIAADNTAQIADIIENNVGWKMVFPHVVPDRERGWGAGGYEVKRTDMEYGKWREANSSRKDPTLVGVGYKSREIIGKHPDGLLVVDDIHDENNSSSERELATVRKILTGTIFPTMTEKTWTVFIGTPWVNGDCLNYVASTGEFAHVRTPVYTEDGELAWPGRFTQEEIERQKKLSGIEFARMFLLDLTKAQNRVFKYQEFPSSQVRYGWPVVGGCDYASNRDYGKIAEGKGDYFALAYLAKLPGGGAVVVDGVLDRCTQGQAEVYLKQAQAIFTNYIGTAIESVGKGDDFVQVVMRNPGLRIIPQHSGRLKKDRRLMIGMQPWMENGTIKVSDAESPFLNELRRELNDYPQSPHDDALDAVYYALRLMPDVLRMPEIGDELPQPWDRKRKQIHPAFAFVRK